MGGSPLGQRLLIKLAANVSAEELAGRLDISQSLLTHLISGALPVPDAVLLKAVDVMLDEADALLPPPLAPRPSTKRDA